MSLLNQISKFLQVTSRKVPDVLGIRALKAIKTRTAGAVEEQMVVFMVSELQE